MKLDGVTIFSRTIPRMAAFFLFLRGRALYLQIKSRIAVVAICRCNIFKKFEATIEIVQKRIGWLVYFPFSMESKLLSMSAKICLTCETQTLSLLLRVTAGFSPAVGSKVPSSLSIPRMVLSTGSGLPVAAPEEAGATAEKAATPLTREARIRAVQNFMVAIPYVLVLNNKPFSVCGKGRRKDQNPDRWNSDVALGCLFFLLERIQQSARASKPTPGTTSAKLHRKARSLSIPMSRANVPPDQLQPSYCLHVVRASTFSNVHPSILQYRTR